MPICNISEILYENFRSLHTLQKKSPYKKQKLKVQEWGLPVGEFQKAFESRVRGLTKLYFCDVHVMWPTLKKPNVLAEVMKALMRDFPGPWNYDEVVKKNRKNHPQEKIQVSKGYHVRR